MFYNNHTVTLNLLGSGTYDIFIILFFFFKGYGDHRDLHVLTHSFPTRRSSDLSRPRRKSRPRFSPQSDTCAQRTARRSEEHTSELQSHRRISYAVFCLKKKKSPTAARSVRVIYAESFTNSDTLSPLSATSLSLIVTTPDPFLNTFFFFNATATPEIYTYCYTLSLHDALPI